MNENLMTRPMPNQMAAFQESKELSEIKGKMFLARQFPRDPEYALSLALRECERKELAEMAQYEFPRGDSVVKGPSIRLVEVLARHWGNIMSGVTEVDSDGQTTTIKCFAWDLETNTSDEKTFAVKHERSAKGSVRKLTDERDIYEMVANKGARRKRACLLAVLPGWYVDEAIKACEKTLTDSLTAGQSMDEVIAKMVEAYFAYGITPEQLAEKVGKPDISKLSKSDVVKLRNLYSAIKDGFVKAGVAFGTESESADSPISEDEENELEALNKTLTAAKEKGKKEK